MIEFVEQKILLYIYHKHENYSFSEICELLGLTLDTLGDYLSKLIKSEYLHYQNGLLCLTSKSKIELDINTEISYPTTDKDVLTDKICPNKAWPLDKVYIPKDF